MTARQSALLFRAAAARSRGPYALLAMVVLAADQATKALVRARLVEGEAWPSRDAWLALSHVENSGAAFGMFQGAGPFLLAATVIGVAAVFAFLLVTPAIDRLYLAALSLILGGAAGNLIDRLAKGTVTDFIDPTHYPAFNLADSTIVVGVLAVIARSLLSNDSERSR
ncbi:MAG: signal peptidase II [Dehalococcoidia bacterium]|nr:signal peptidase II [Dehalococcoidia bacterium]